MIQGVGLGFRRELADALLAATDDAPRFVELAPENWMGIGGRWKRVVDQIVERYPILCHGLSLSLGSPEPLDWEFIEKLKAFLDAVDAKIYSEHLSYSKCDNAHLYDLLPIPFCMEAVEHVAGRIGEVQDYLGRRIAIENVSYYTPVAPQMDEASFLRAVLERADCDLLLDINNVIVNAHNHSYDPKAFIEALPLERVVYIHMAGHEEVEGIKIDTHGEAICEDVYALFSWASGEIGSVPILLERDHNLPPYEELVAEMRQLEQLAGVCCAA